MKLKVCGAKAAETDTQPLVSPEDGKGGAERRLM